MSDQKNVIVEEIRMAVEDGQPKATEQLVKRALAEGVSAEVILNQGMVEAMQQVGQRYKENDVFIPGILAAARAMRAGTTVLEPVLDQKHEGKIGTVIVGTVEGDLHDMGKNLVAIMFRCAGFEVIDLGVDVSDKQFLTALRKYPQTSIVCISSLLSTTMPGMEKVIKTIRHADKKKRLKIMVGGAPVTQEYAETIGADAYTENAVDAARIARSFVI